MNKDEIIRQAMNEIYDLLEKHFQDKHVEAVTKKLIALEEAQGVFADKVVTEVCRDIAIKAIRGSDE